MTAALSSLAWATGWSEADVIVWAASDDSKGNNTIGMLDLTTGQFTVTGTTSQIIFSLASTPSGNLVAGVSIPDAHLYSVEPNGAMSQFGSAQGQGSFYGLASAGPSGFYGAALAGNYPLDKISSDGNSISTIGPMGDLYVVPTGGLAFGPDGGLYINNYTHQGINQFYRVDPSTAALTPIGTGLGTPNNDVLSLVTAGGLLYGIDTSGGTGIYTIDTTTGLATFTGVNYSSNFGIDAAVAIVPAAAIVPEPSSLKLSIVSTLALVGLACLSRRYRGRAA
jgi:hypothetical protein